MERPDTEQAAVGEQKNAELWSPETGDLGLVAVPPANLSPWKRSFTSPGLGFLMCEVMEMKESVPRAPFRSLCVSTMIVPPPHRPSN